MEELKRLWSVLSTDEQEFVEQLAKKMEVSYKEYKQQKATSNAKGFFFEFYENGGRVLVCPIDCPILGIQEIYFPYDETFKMEVRVFIARSNGRAVSEESYDVLKQRLFDMYG